MQIYLKAAQFLLPVWLVSHLICGLNSFDIGLNGIFVHLHTDMQWVAYILKDGETAAPEELEELLAKGNRFRDIVMEEMKEAASNAKQEFDNLKSSFDGYKDIVDKLKECTEGTKEWRDAVKEVNDYVLELLSNSPNLMN